MLDCCVGGHVNIRPILAMALALPLPAAEIVVARDGSGNFTSVQAAVDSVPADNTKSVTIHIKPGVYTENITVPKEKPFLTMRGAAAARPALPFHNSAANSGGTSKSASVYIWAADFTAENLTFENSFGVGSQAVALYVNADRATFRKCRLLGWQD